MKMLCSLGCGQEVESEGSKSRITYREVSGWEKIRARGGANAIAMRKESGRIACSSCIERLKSGIDPGQLTIA